MSKIPEDLICGIPYSAIIDRYWAALCFFSENLIGERNIAVEITIENFEKLLVWRDSLTEPKAIKKFLYHSVSDSCWDYLQMKAIDTGKNHGFKSKEEFETVAVLQAIKAEVVLVIFLEIHHTT